MEEVDETRAEEVLRFYHELLRTPGWIMLQALLQQQVDAMQQEILFTPCKSIDDAFQQEFKKGQLEGRLAVAELVNTAIANAEYDKSLNKGANENG